MIDRDMNVCVYVCACVYGYTVVTPKIVSPAINADNTMTFIGHVKESEQY